jgi:hypothetical protein
MMWIWGFLKSYWLLIAAGVLVAALAVYVGMAERNRALVGHYRTENAQQAALIGQQGERIRALNEQRDRANQEALRKLAQARRGLILARVEAEKIRQQRDQITAALSASRREWAEAMQHDPTLADFVAHPVPAAVWRRLCNATDNC